MAPNSYPKITQTSHDLHKDTSSVAASGHSCGSLGSSGRATSTLQGLGSALNVQTLITAAERRETQIETPSSEVQDKILFIINNIAFANIETKAEEFAACLQESYYLWFAQYLVIKRASVEPNFHDLYIKFLECVNLKGLYKAIVKATYENCKILLKSELIKSTSEERLLLKNMGSWVGKLTIGRNQVLIASEINPKSLIIEAYKKGLLTALIPFVCKILEACQSSIAYKHPNPWTAAILQLLAEIHSTPGLKSNIKFEIEVLFRNLEIDMRDITPSSILKDHKLELVGNPDFRGNITDTAPQKLNQGHTPDDVAGHAQEDPSQSSIPVNEISTGIPIMRHYPFINQQLSALGLDMYSQSLIPSIVDIAIRGTASLIYRWSCRAATSRVNEYLMRGLYHIRGIRTFQGLRFLEALNNYSPDADETRFFHQAHLAVAHSVVAYLAGYHSQIKGKLCNSLAWHLRNLFIRANMQTESLELAFKIVTGYYLDIGTQHIQHGAVRKAKEVIERELLHQMAIRRRGRIVSLPSNADHVSQHSSVYPQQVFEAIYPTRTRISWSEADRVEIGSKAGNSGNGL